MTQLPDLGRPLLKMRPQWQPVSRYGPLRRHVGCALLAICAAAALSGSPSWADRDTPPDNLELIIDTAAGAVVAGLADLDLTALSPSRGDGELRPPITLHVAARGRHTADWVVEHVLVEELLKRGISVMADSGAAPTLSFRIVELGIWANSGVLRPSVERRCRVSLSLQLEGAGELAWTGSATHVLTDRVEKRRVAALQSSTYAFAKTDVEEQSWGKYVEPVIVSSVLGSLVYLFFSNR